MEENKKNDLNFYIALMIAVVILVAAYMYLRSSVIFMSSPTVKMGEGM